MGAINPQVLVTLEDNMRVLNENSYAALSASGNLWYKDVAKIIPSTGRKELLFWFLSTARIRDQGFSGGNMRFDDLAMLNTEYENKDSGAGFEMSFNELNDLDQHAVRAAAKWSTDMGHQIAYHPQEQVSTLIQAGTSDLGYDGVAFFIGTAAQLVAGTAHPYNPFDLSAGYYSNRFTGAAGSTDPAVASYGYPGACPIDTSVAVDVALQNLGKIYGYIRSIKQANGAQPRLLKPVGILHPPQLTTRVVELTQAKTIAQAAGTYGGGSADVEAVIKRLGLGQPIEVPEFANDATTYYIICEWQSMSELGPIVYQNREPYRITYYSGQSGGGLSPRLDVAKKLEWHNFGRNTTGYGHPYLIFRCEAT